MITMKKYILTLISLAFLACVSDNSFSTPDVCEGGRCQTYSLSNAAIPFNETFDNFALWQVANTEGERKWYLKQHDGKPFAIMSAFDGQNQPGVSVESWLISPVFDFDAQENETLEFKLADYYSNDDPLKVFYSTDYDGENIKKATWRELTPPNTLFNNPKKADYKYESSGNINLSSIQGKAVIAFIYDSNKGKITSTAQLSEVHITSGKKEEQTSTHSTTSSRHSTGELIISEYVEGSSYNKYIELYNPTDHAVDLSEYVLAKDYNGNNNFEKDKKYLNGILDSKGTIVYANSKADIYKGDLADGLDLDSVINFNGNDQIALKKNGKIIDFIGKEGDNDFAKDVTLRRKSDINTPSATWNESEWEKLNKNDISGLGKR